MTSRNFEALTLLEAILMHRTCWGLLILMVGARRIVKLLGEFGSGREWIVMCRHAPCFSLVPVRISIRVFVTYYDAKSLMDALDRSLVCVCQSALWFAVALKTRLGFIIFV